ncbi:SDR family NAD(P)-dependent oxidoreductase [Nocardiopsis akebiae]|uniref:SDR family NAD(P)-dependent oxidoreductase n=1 Tax=Nocardiopsis akebiae TaxID=2831968 RepID=A0ABX8C0J4_9ACTN|nr:SDR family NAD(P)-dependent oxidoreductase [Nocardiopsis akebiae]QUX26969.1 SDR family NAD(P)-dependent oxidoreductase [Nocardiopsis akebiae]
MDRRLERLLSDLKADRVSKEDVKRFLASRGQAVPTGHMPVQALRPEPELLRCEPVWRASEGAVTGREPGHVVLLVGESAFERPLRELDAAVDVRLLESGAAGLAERYADFAAQVLAALRALLGQPSSSRTLVQLVCSRSGEAFLLSGLFGMVRSAALENPRIVPQMVLVDAAEPPDGAAERILACRDRTGDRVVRLRDGGVREVLTWRELRAPEHTALPWREGGTYVITGGLGGLGLIFARDLLTSVRSASVVVTGRSPLDGDRSRLLEGLRRTHARVEYERLDVSDTAGVEALLSGVRHEHGGVHGIIHGAGVLRDGFVLGKGAEEMLEVLAPKVAGTVNLDAATKDDSLDFFALFSSAAAVTGNAGQSDYAAANAFMDAFAHHRGALAAEGLRSGLSLSLNWPLWAEGGMPVDAETERELWDRVGMRALRTESGVRAFHACLASAHQQVMVVEGDGTRIRGTLLGQQPVAPAPAPASAPVAEARAGVEEEALHDAVVSGLTRMFGRVTGLPGERIDAQTPFEQYGIDSIVVTRINRRLAETFADLPKTLLYETASLDALARRLLRERREACLVWTGTAVRQAASAPRPQRAPEQAPRRPGSEPAPAASAVARPAAPSADAIAVVGMSGRFPQARDLREFWENLAVGRDSVTELPEDRWPLDGFYHPDRDEAVAAGLSYGKWGGFLDGFADFDPLFFNISPQEAMNTDPQERLFLQESWNALEDAGYTRRRLAEAHGGRVGVFAGVSKTGFDLYGPELWRRDERLHPLTSFASVANRVSYLLDLKGPSLPIDTLCSSSLSAVHEAVEHLRRGECDLAVAGGVNLYLHPSNFTLMSGKRMLSDDGACRSFGAGANGFVPGEGAAVVLLKRLVDAERDGDVIHAVVRGSSINHGGRTNGYTVPNPVAQAGVVREALDRAGVRADEVSFVEAHGTGTELGDPIEIDGLSQAFAPDTDARQYCAIGSAKSNIGHLEAAAGIAGLLKVILQMQNGQLVPSLHARETNPNIDFARTPFRLQRETAEWARPTVRGAHGETVVRNRIAGVSSFGAGGSNAHVVLEEYRGRAARLSEAPDTPWLIVLSAKDTARLRERARDLIGWLSRQDPADLDLGAVAHTLQLGREEMEARLALRVGSPDELTGKLAAFAAGDGDVEGLHLGAVKEHRETLAAFGSDSDMAATVNMWIDKGKFDKLLGLWVKGLAVDWGRLYGDRRPRMLALPGYPFARERYWVGDLVREPAGAAPGVHRLHPLVHANTSTLDVQRFGSVFSGEEPFLADHVVQGRRILPGAAYLEMARAALEASLDQNPRGTVLRDVVWARPLVVGEHPAHLMTTLHALEGDGGADGVAGRADAGGRVAFEISSVPGGGPGSEPVVHSQGVALALHDGEVPAEPVDLAALRAACGAARLDAEHCYRVYRDLGLDYGAAHRGLESIEIGDGQALARLGLPSGPRAAGEGYVLHPSLLDAALQSSIGLFARDGAAADSANAVLRLPFALDELRILGPCTRRMWAWVRFSHDDQPDSGVRKLDIDLLDDAGVPRCRLRGLTSRAYEADPPTTRPAGDLPHRAAQPSATAGTTDGGAPPRGTLEERARRYLVSLLASELRLPADRIDAGVALEHYGIDSIMAMNLTNRLEQVFGPLPKTLFFEYQDISSLAEYFLDLHNERLSALLAEAAPEAPGGAEGGTGRDGGAVSARVRRRPAARSAQRRPETADEDTDVAIIGLAGRYPQARDVGEFWRNLAEGRDCVTEIPADRWDHSRYFDPDRSASGRTYTKWGGFLDKADHFDPLFFNIAPREAAFMDPQERLFLECVHATMEDAGYTREALSRHAERGLPGGVGVFVGVMYEEYQLYGAQEQERGRNVTLSGSASTIANRVSYVFDLHGPSLAVDTMCSSSLTALHLACQSLRLGDCEVAVAGGVNLSLHPNKYLMLASGKYASSRGRCESFGEGGDGYVPAEGVGAVLLKPLSRAVEDRDFIHGVIKSTAVNHGGKTNGYSVPNPRAQHNVIGHALRAAGVDARSVSYVEAHGTGTSLGDPVEIAGLTKAFSRYTGDRQFCAIGSVKSNIGHAESAAGISALTKVLLQMKHGQLVPSLHAEVLNPHIDFGSTPFRVQRELAEWRRPTGADGVRVPRIAGISSFGAGGSNAHAIVSEYVPPNGRESGTDAEGPAVVVLSARTEDGLRAQAGQLLSWTSGQEGAATALADIAYTLQVGREAYEERLGLVAATTGELTAKLEAFLEGGAEAAGLYRGRVERRQGALAVFTADEGRARALDADIARRSYDALLALWVVGLTVDWTKLHGDTAPRRVPMPTYPFQGERYWLPEPADVGSHPPAPSGRIHPLLHVNTSTLNEQHFTSVYTGEEFFLRDHRVQGERVLSGAACLELARAAVEASLDEPYAALTIGNVVWTRPVTAGEGGLTVQVRLRARSANEIGFEILTPGDADRATGEAVHGEGVVVVTRSSADADDDVRVDLSALRTECSAPGPDADELYAAFEARGLRYGPGHRGVRRLWTGADQVLARIALPSGIRDTLDEYGLHPTLLDAALHACAGLRTPLGGEGLLLPFAVDEVQILGPCPPEMWAWARNTAGREGERVRRLDIDLCDDEGRVRVRLGGVALRAHTTPTPDGELLAAPAWIAEDLREAADPAPEGLVLVAELPDVAAALEAHDTARVVRLDSDAADVGARYTDHSLRVLGEVKKLLGERERHPVRVQLVASSADPRPCEGLMALLRSAQLENPRLLGQLVLLDPRDGVGRAAARVRAERAGLADTAVRYLGGSREVLRWREEDGGARPAQVPWKDGGVYLITGGAGALGGVFAQDIAVRVRAPRIVVTGRSPLDAHKEALLERLRRLGAEAVYEQADVAVRDEAVELVRGVRRRFGRIDGVLHSAGLIRDAFVLSKDAGEFARVLAPKVAGLVHLDEATHDADLDFLVAFSSVAGALGNVGQSDYATANAFMDAYAAHRNALVARGERRGRTLSIGWPLWAEGGMRVDAATERSLRESFGLVPLSSETGVRALYRALASGRDQVLVLAGDRPKLRRTLLGGFLVDGPAEQSPPEAEAVPMAGKDRAPEPDGAALDESTAQRAVSYFKRLLSSAIDLPVARIDAEASLEDYGIDSVMTMEMIRVLEGVFGSLPKTLFFEHRTIAALTRHFLEAYPDQIRELLPAAGVRSREAAEGRPVRPDRRAPEAERGRRTLPAAPVRATAVRGGEEETGDVAVIGLAGRYPQARDVREFWRNLASGKDCVTEVPADRWDRDRFFDPDRGVSGKSYSKWGGFLDGAYDFDPRFFGISPREAEIMDPQERLFLQCVHDAVEDAGYSRDTGKDRKGVVLDGRVGVFVGVMYEEYQLFGAQSQLGEAPLAVAGNPASIANRVSYYFNLRGPSMSVDTMCSSSLTAIHLACRSLRWGDCETAVAGGVNLSLHPNKYLLLSQGRFASSNGRCESFGAGGDGYVPSEGVGAVLLKPLSKAVADGDRIYGVVKGTAVNHGGRTNGYSVPDPSAQADTVSLALERAGVDARAVSYVEAHGTGTALGDPIEIAGLSKAFGADTDDRGFCAIGSVKSNIGHAESAAGIAGVTKVLLQLQHGRLAPSLHASALNPHIDFERTPFVVQRELTEWPRQRDGGTGRTVPRVAGVSSFGAGGANAHVVIAEYTPQDPEQTSPDGTAPPTVVPLSARRPEQLRARAEQLWEWLERPESADLALADVGYTLQVGREPMEERLGLLATSLPGLREGLRRFLDGVSAVGEAFRGTVTRDGAVPALFDADSDLDAMIAAWADKGKYEKLLELWVNGVPVDWRLLHGPRTPRRIALPTYPFARERYFPFDGASAVNPTPHGGPVPLHPLAQVNTSDFTEQRFTSVLTGEEFFLRDHVVHGARVMPGAALLEAVVAAASLSCRTAVGPSAPLALRDVVLLRPLRVADEPYELHVGLRPEDDGDIRFRVSGALKGTDAEEAVSCTEGVLYLVEGVEETVLDLPALRAACDLPGLTAERCYELYRESGIAYGPAHRAVRHVWAGRRQALAQLALPEPLRGTEDDFTLHPSMLDAALQACVGVLGRLRGSDAAESGAGLPVPFAVDDVLVLDACTTEMWAWVRPSAEQDPATPKLDIDLADERGRIRVRIGGLSFRGLDGAPLRDPVQVRGPSLAQDEAILLRPLWRERPAPLGASGTDDARTTVLLAGLPEVADLLEDTDPGEVVPLTTRDESVDGRYAAYGTQILEHLRSRVRGAAGRSRIQLVVPGAPDAVPLTGLAAMLQTAHIENPDVTGQVVVLDPTDTPELAAARILENRNRFEDAFVRYANGRREVRTWAEDDSAPPSALPWKEGGVYLVTGGAGALGQVFAKEIAARTGNATLVLTGRSPLDPQRRGAVEAVEAAGAGAAYYEQADVSNRAEADALIARTVERCGRIDGVIHSAGITRDSFILGKPVRDFLDVLAPKVSGTVNLDAATRHLPLDFFVTFSSASGAHGNTGQVDYAAANAFLDAYAWYRQDLVDRGERSGRSQSVGWPLWAEGGMRVAEGTEAVLRGRHGVVPLETAAGVRSLYRILHSEYTQVTVSASVRGRAPVGSDSGSPLSRQSLLVAPSVGTES